MFTTLLASNAPKVRTRGSTAASLALHTVMIGTAVWLTAQQASARIVPNDAHIAYLAPRTPPEQPAVKSPSTPPPAAPAIAAVPTSSVPTIAPGGLPPIDLSALPAGEVVFTTGPSRPGTPGGNAAPAASGDAPYDGFTVDKPVEPLAGQPAPRYPAMLRTTGVEGRVDVRFVVDTLGRVESESLQFIGASHQLFVEAVKAALLRQRFIPAEAAGHRVRQLVTQPFVFTIRP